MPVATAQDAGGLGVVLRGKTSAEVAQGIVGGADEAMLICHVPVEAGCKMTKKVAYTRLLQDLEHLQVDKIAHHRQGDNGCKAEHGRKQLAQEF